jgi:hypothetical protein
MGRATCGLAAGAGQPDDIMALGVTEAGLGPPRLWTNGKARKLQSMHGH